MKKNAFSLAELMICLALVGIISSITLSTQNARPNSNMIFLKKAYQTTTEVVADMLTIDAYYPEGLLNDTRAPENARQNLIGYDDNTTRVNYEGESKFCSLFVNYTNTTGNIDCINSRTLNQGGNFTTNDGIVWSLPITEFSDLHPYPIGIDINGAETPNCNAIAPDCTNPDQFIFMIDNTGRITIPDERTREYLSKNKKILR